MAIHTAADCLVDVLRAWRVDVVFGVPGIGTEGLLEALERRREEIRLIRALGEEAASYMACGYAACTGRLGVCLAASGAGGLRLLNGLHRARLDGLPVLALTGGRVPPFVDPFAPPDMDLERVLLDATAYSARVVAVGQVESLASLACRSAIVRSGVAHLDMPAHIQHEWSAERSRPRADRAITSMPALRPAPDEVARTAVLLNTGRRVAIFAGRGAIGAVDELEVVAELLGAPIIKTVRGKTAVPDDSLYSTGPDGLAGSGAAQDILERCDTLLVVGASPPELAPPARIVQIDRDPARIGLRCPVDAAVAGRASDVLTNLIPQLRRNPNRHFLERVQKRARLDDSLHHRDPDAGAPSPAVELARQIGSRLASDAIVSSDSGSIASGCAERIPTRRDQSFLLTAAAEPMPLGLPYAIAARVAFPERQAVALVTPGGVPSMVSELATAVARRLPVFVVVLSPAQGDTPRLDIVAMAEACGAEGLRADAARVEEALERAFAATAPIVVEIPVATAEGRHDTAPAAAVRESA